MAELPATHYVREIALDGTGGAVRETSAAITAKIEELVKFLFPRGKGYDATPLTERGGEACLAVSMSGWRIDVTCSAGNNIRYVAGEQVRYFSYSVDARSVIPAVVKAERLGKALGSWLKLVFAIGFVVLLFLACRAFAEILGLTGLSVPVMLFLGAIALGSAVGVAVGELVGGVAAAIAYAGACRKPGVRSALADWLKLEEGLDRILDVAESTGSDVSE